MKETRGSSKAATGKAAGHSDGRKTNRGGARGGAEGAGCRKGMRASREDDAGGRQICGGLWQSELHDETISFFAFPDFTTS
jgi:hypothetical protein